MAVIGNLKPFIDDRGWLMAIDFSKAPFPCKRIFFVGGVPKGMRRGDHAHHETQQWLICLKGRIKVGLHNGKELTEFEISKGDTVHIDKLTWDYQEFLTGGELLAVLCSTEYNPADYILDFKEFCNLKA